MLDKSIGRCYNLYYIIMNKKDIKNLILENNANLPDDAALVIGYLFEAIDSNISLKTKLSEQDIVEYADAIVQIRLDCMNDTIKTSTELVIEVSENVLLPKFKVAELTKVKKLVEQFLIKPEAERYWNKYA